MAVNDRLIMIAVKLIYLLTTQWQAVEIKVTFNDMSYDVLFEGGGVEGKAK